MDAGQPITRGRLILRRFLRQKSGVAALVVLVLIFLLAYLGPYLTHWKFDDFDQTNILTGPDSNHFMGVDEVGRDVYARTLKGLQKSLVIGLVAALVTTSIAAVAGLAGRLLRQVHRPHRGVDHRPAAGAARPS